MTGDLWPNPTSAFELRKHLASEPDPNATVEVYEIEPDEGGGMRDPEVQHSADLVADAEAKQRRKSECSHAVFDALAPILIKYGSVMTHKVVREWMGERTDAADQA